MSELGLLVQEIETCVLCDLSSQRTRTVPGEGSSYADLMFIGEGPGFFEDREGRPFVGAAGRFLDELLESIDLDRKDVYITNMVKCRPPNNRDPLPSEINACRPFLERQIEMIAPKVIVTLGRHSFSKFFPGEAISKARGKSRRWGNLVIFPVYHPAAALHNPKLRTVIEDDFRQLPILLENLEGPHEEPDASPVQQLTLFE